MYLGLWCGELYYGRFMCVLPVMKGRVNADVLYLLGEPIEGSRW